MAIDIAWYHHECWDGSGYPKGLVGEEIPLAARIVKVVDVFDAMVSRRRYKEAIPLEETLKFMQDNAGKEFDPDIIRVFMRIYRNFKGI
jgi:putative two-component system response regulator